MIYVLWLVIKWLYIAVGVGICTYAILLIVAAAWSWWAYRDAAVAIQRWADMTQGVPRLLE